MTFDAMTEHYEEITVCGTEIRERLYSKKSYSHELRRRCS